MATLGNAAAWAQPPSWQTIAAHNTASTITTAQYQAAIAQINAQHATQDNQVTISMDDWLTEPAETLSQDSLTQAINTISSLGNGLHALHVEHNLLIISNLKIVRNLFSLFFFYIK